MENINKYSVSLVYQKQTSTINDTTTESLLRVQILSAISEEEALGKTIKYFEEETRDFLLSMKVVLNISDCLFSEGDIITNGLFDAKLDSKPTLKADIIWLHNDTHDNVDVSKFTLKKIPNNK